VRRRGRWIGVALVASALAAVVAAPARSHVAFSPATLGVGTATRLQAEVPNERPEQATTRVSLRFPAGFSVDPSQPPAGWTVSRAGRSVTWEGGRLAGEGAVTFPIDVTADVAAGTYEVKLVQGYDDGASVPTTTRLTVLPALGEAAPKQHVGRAIAAAAAGLVVVLGSLLGLHLLRRRRSRPAQADRAA